MIDRSQFLEKHRISEDKYEAAALGWDALTEIYEDYCASQSDLEAAATGIADLLRRIPAVHSLKIRVKDPEHLLAKIIRKRAEEGSRDISLHNYRQEITDLIGVRALHLFREDWEPIHDYIVTKWELHEQPTAYVKQGEPAEFTDHAANKGCVVKEHEAGYRSVHYLIKSSATKRKHIAEVQVRTIFEEAWSELDHQLRYPYELGNPLLDQFLTIFNRLAGSADEMGSFVRRLLSELRQGALERERLREELKEKIRQQNIDRTEKEELTRKVDELSQYAPTTAPLAIPSGYPGAILGSGSRLTGSLHLPLSRECSNCGREFTEDALAGLGPGSDLCAECRIASCLSRKKICSKCGKEYSDTELNQSGTRPNLCSQCCEA